MANVRGPRMARFMTIASAGQLKPGAHGSRVAGVKKKLLRSWRLYVLFILPLIYFVVFKYGAITWLLISVKKFNPVAGLWGSEWIGFVNFRNFLNDAYFWKLVRNTLLLNMGLLVFYFPFPIFLALLINDVRWKFFRKAVQTISYLPYFMSTVVVCGLVVSYAASDGPINNALFALTGARVNFMTNPALFRPIYIISEIWQRGGWASIIYLAALSNIDTEMYEAATIDGANRWHQLIYISLPGIAPVISIQLLLTLGHILSVGYEKILLLYSGPTYETADVISTYLYRRGLVAADYSYGAAVSLFQAAISLVLIIMANKAARKIGPASLW